MKLKNPHAESFVPDGSSLCVALHRTTHLCIAAHQDDVELMALHGILQCMHKDDTHFTAVIVTNGAGSPRAGVYASYTDEKMQAIRKVEQKKAAVIGEYSACLLLDYPSAKVKAQEDRDVIEEIKTLLQETRPRILYTHNLADKHDTHIGVVTKVIVALRELDPALHPEKVYGCEVWRALDWVNPQDKVVFDVSERPNIASALIEVFDSQVSGGKRYDLAAQGRRLANATFADSHQTDEGNSSIYALDLTPLIQDPSLDVTTFILDVIARFAKDVEQKIRAVLGSF